MILERVTTPRGELVLRRDGDDFEVISNGVFLMDTRNGDSERLLVTAALDRCQGPVRVLIGGLGVGFSLVEALRDPRVVEVVVVEIEPTILDWHHRHLGHLTADALADPRTTVVVADLVTYLRSAEVRYDAICLDIDNGPDWTVTTDNESLYGDSGTAAVVARLASGGAVSIWSAAPAPAYETVLHRHFARVETHEVTVQRGQPDVVIVGSSPGSL